MAENEKEKTSCDKDLRSDGKEGLLRAPPRRRKSARKQRENQDGPCPAERIGTSSSDETRLETEPQCTDKAVQFHTCEDVENAENPSAILEANDSNNSSRDIHSFTVAHCSETKMSVSSTDTDENISGSLDLDTKAKQSQGDSSEYNEMHNTSETPQQSESIVASKETSSVRSEGEDMGNKTSRTDDIIAPRNNQVFDKDPRENENLVDSNEAGYSNKQVEDFCWIDTQSSHGNTCSTATENAINSNETGHSNNNNSKLPHVINTTLEDSDTTAVSFNGTITQTDNTVDGKILSNEGDSEMQLCKEERKLSGEEAYNCIPECQKTEAHEQSTDSDSKNQPEAHEQSTDSDSKNQPEAHEQSTDSDSKNQPKVCKQSTDTDSKNQPESCKQSIDSYSKNQPKACKQSTDNDSKNQPEACKQSTYTDSKNQPKLSNEEEIEAHNPESLPKTSSQDDLNIESIMPYKTLENAESDSTSFKSVEDDEYSTGSDKDSFYSDFTSSEGEYNMEDAERLFGVGDFIDEDETAQLCDGTYPSLGDDPVKQILSVFPNTEYLSVTDDNGTGHDTTHKEEVNNDTHDDGCLGDGSHGDSSLTDSINLSEEKANSLKRKIGSFKIVRKAEAYSGDEDIKTAEILRNNSLEKGDRESIQAGLDGGGEKALGFVHKEFSGYKPDDDSVFKDAELKDDELQSSVRQGSYSSNHEKEGTLEISRDRHCDGSPRMRSRSEGDIYDLEFEEHFYFGKQHTLPRRAQSSKLNTDVAGFTSSVIECREVTSPIETMGSSNEDLTLVDHNNASPGLEKDKVEGLRIEGNMGMQTQSRDSSTLESDSVMDDGIIRGSSASMNKEDSNISKQYISKVLGDQLPRALSIVREETASSLELDLDCCPRTPSEVAVVQESRSDGDASGMPIDNMKGFDGSSDCSNRIVSPTRVTYDGVQQENLSSNKTTSNIEKPKDDGALQEKTPSLQNAVSDSPTQTSAAKEGSPTKLSLSADTDNKVVLRKKKIGNLRRKWLSFSMVETSGSSITSDNGVHLKSYRKKKGSDETDSVVAGSSPSETPVKSDTGSNAFSGVVEGSKQVVFNVETTEEAAEKEEESPQRPPRKVKLGHSKSFNTPGTERKLAVKRNKKVRAERSFRWQTLSGGIDVTPAEWFRLSRLSACKLVHEGPVTLVTDALTAMFPHFPTDKRSQVALELYTTERTYVRGLETVIELFKTPLEEYLDEKEMETMFSNIYSIFQLNKDMVFSLCERITHWKEDQCIGDIFSEMAPRFKIYATYCNNYDAAETLIKQKIKKKKDFEAFLNMCYSDPVCQPGLTLQAYLITVVQRIPRYLLLLRDLVKSTPSHHHDSRHLKDGLQKMHNIAEYINNQLQAVQGQRAMAELRSRVIGIKAFETQGRALIKEGEVSLMSTKKTYKCLLFNDMLVFAAKNATKQSEVELTLELKTLWVTDLDDNDPQTKDAIEVYTAERSYIMYAGSRNDKKHWLQKLRTAIAIQLHGDEATDSREITHRKTAFTYKDGRIYCGSFVDGKRHGQGVLAWQNRTRYEGLFEDDERSGIGVLTYNTGEKYNGQWLDDKQCGIGTLKYPNGDYYHGEWCDGKMHGKGMIEFSNKDLLEGEFIDGDLQGVARLRCSNGMTYDGTWKNSKKHGKGKLVFANGDTYSGEFFNDRMHGQGEMLYAKNGATYNGRWKNSQRHGLGTYKAPDGTIYAGEWSGDHIQGRGKMAYPNKDSYDGTWFRNMRFGKGAYVFHEGVYEGQFEYDFRHGHGLMKYSDGSEYEGDWQNDQRHGQGKIIYGDLAVYEGAWFHNLRHGKGKMAYQDGATYDGNWELDSEHGLDGVYTDAISRYAYRGEWLHGRREGRGVETTAHGAYKGEFKDNMRHGRGQETLRCGTVYEGLWKEDRKCGEGIRKILNGAAETQHWQDGQLVDKDETVAPDLPLLQRR